ncbi:MAG: glucokinase [Rhodobacterales bacterium]|nr:glucokinase [Rhodobacterales bacterium]
MMPNLIADIGGTNARFALAGAGGAVDSPLVLDVTAHDTLADAVRAYLAQVKPARPPTRGAVAVASPVLGDQVTMTNHRWAFSIEDTRRDLGLENLQVINDFTAVALALPHLGPGDLAPVGGGQAAARSPLAVIGPGTGLGVSAVVPAGFGWAPLTTEGGHVTMAPATDREAAVLDALRHRFGHVSAERVCSGPGLVNLWTALGQVDGDPDGDAPEPAGVTARAEAGDARAAEAVDLMCAFLGTAAGNLCLTLGARGGLFVAGGIVPRLGDRFAASPFRRRFEEKGRFAGYLSAVPTQVITHPHPAFVGLSWLMGTGRG